MKTESTIGERALTVERDFACPHAHNVVSVSGLPYTWAQRFLLASDVHLDNDKCCRGVIRRDLEEALKTDAIILLGGDLFCAMQGKFDPRSSKQDIPEDIWRIMRGVKGKKPGKPYLDALLQYAFDFLEPYKRNIAFIGKGNHETKIKQRLEFDLTENLCLRLRDAGGIAQAGAYEGFIRLIFARTKTQRSSKAIYYHHGWGTGGEVSKGAHQFSRTHATVEGCDIHWTQHIHREMRQSEEKLRYERGRPQMVQVENLRTSTYKHETGRGEGWLTEKGPGVRPIGGAWLEVSQDGDNDVIFEVRRTKRPTPKELSAA